MADIVYRPLETALVRTARGLGCRVLDGGGMAVFQAVEAFRRTFASGEQMLGAQVAEPEEEPAAERTTEQLVVKRG